MQSLPQNIFVTGIGTGVGKTVASAILTEALRADYWKPVQCGNLENSDSVLVRSLIGNTASQIYPERYAFRTASSPHYAAEVEGAQIEMKNFLVPKTDNMLIIEGAGGLMVPLNRKECVVDLIGFLNVPAVLVCRNYLGSINHTLLSIELLKQKGIRLLGLIFNGENFLDNEEVIKSFGDTVILGKIDESQAIDEAFIKQQALQLKDSIQKYYTL